MKLIDTSNLISWAISTSSNGELPGLIKDLIRATATDIESIRFPDGDAVSMSGFDGVLTLSDIENEYVPNGLSVWEMGTEENPGNKAERDYRKRTDNQNINNKKDITFVFVSPRRWGNKDKWLEEKREEGVWKDVKGIDGVDLQEWLALAPVIALKFAQNLGHVPPEGVFLLEDEWKFIKCRSKPNLVESLVTAGREKECQTLIKRLLGPPHSIVIQGDSPQEAVAFSLATLLQIEDDEHKKRLLSRTLVISEQNAARMLSPSKPLIIVISNEHIKSSALPSYGHHVIKPVGTDAMNPNDPIKLPRPGSDVFGKELEKMGMKHDEARMVAKLCARSVTVFQRLKPSENADPPNWASDHRVNDLIPAMLAGRWDSNNDQDTSILCQLYQCDEYKDVEEKISHFLSVNEAPLQKVGQVWSLTAPADSFSLIARHISSRQFEIFKKVFDEVLGEIDPVTELAPDERMYAAIKGAKRKYSEWIRKGLSETLIIISQLGPSINNIQCPSTPEIFVNNIVRDLPNLENWDLIASLRDQYSILMEAAPHPLLEALDKAIEGNPEGFKHLTEEGKDTFGGHSLHTGILWALETMAWDPHYLKKVSLILAKLASLDPGGRLLNRPLNSLNNIFLCWHPGTNANLDQRIEALEFVTTNVEDIAWPLLESLLPKTGSRVTSSTSKPNWSEAGRDKREKLTYGIIWKAEDDVISRALKLAQARPERWKSILDSITRYPENLKKEVIEMLLAIATDNLDEHTRSELWSVLRDFINKHLTYRDADWALDSETLRTLEEITKKFEPKDIINKNAWLFDEYLPNLPNIKKRDYKDFEKEAEKLRDQAVSEVIHNMGYDGIVQLAKNAKLQNLVGNACISYCEHEEQVYNLIVHSADVGNDLLDFIATLSAGANKKFSTNWKNFMLEKMKNNKDWSPIIRSCLFLFWPMNTETWEVVESTDKETVNEYWKRANFFAFDGTPEEKHNAIKNLIRAGRSKDVFDAITFENEGISSDVIIEVAHSVIEKLNQIDNEEEFKANCPSYPAEFIKVVHDRNDIDENEIIKLEYAFLPVLGYNTDVNLKIYNKLSRDPQLFVSVLCDVFKASSQEHSSEPTPEQRNRAHYGFRLLEGWHKIPGMREDNFIDKNELMNWIKEARKLCREVDRTDIGDQYIGKVLAHAPKDPTDDAWPHKTIRESVEILKSEQIELGIRIERVNMRGTYTKDLFEGGDQERQLAKNYKDWADRCTQWSRIHGLLEKIAEEWEYEANREDERAQQNRLRL